ncbi:Glucose-6-phosphate 1-dehydrogenase [Pigmentiphaga humi]|uniref:Glucose-6-phosphate 1-dehydrogenase n=1 Tax=Pigmentiphaga humi TaxID=2478468 RepID=A0A3P4B7A9_9BURK|nr:glucose-6-phosphate dehydrogenase [Pigmentiphaga humi]VCU72163.1 Glucose-6-phosphate 1-dehydrogenase [Pigmentiphaga humi]
MESTPNRPAPAPAPPCTLVIFGATGDMTGRLLMPALYNLARVGALDPAFRVIGIGRRELDDAAFRDGLTASMDDVVASRGAAAPQFDPQAWQWLMQRASYLAGDFKDGQTYGSLDKRLAGAQGGVIFYLSTDPDFFLPIARQLHDAGMFKQSSGRWRRLVVEKPFGRDLASARELNRQLAKAVNESQIFRIDHFLGKETVQNILVSRFANSVFENSWNRLFIDHVQITAAEALGLERRSSFYEQTGALRDMVPNHLFQLLAMVAMEPPNAFEADAVRTEKEKLLEAIRLQTPAEALIHSVRGQYRAGTVGGKAMRGYLEEEGVAPDSRTETYVALKLCIDNWRWAGVPFYLRTGKALARRQTQIVIAFKDAGHALFCEAEHCKPPANTLVLQIQPDEGLFFHMQAKVPGSKLGTAPVSMDFRYRDHFPPSHSSGYETLIYDCMVGDATLFQRAADIELGWKAVQPFQQAWAEGGDIHPYRAGSQGPAAADDLLARDGRAWLSLE